jgi:calcium-dependent protein kinase
MIDFLKKIDLDGDGYIDFNEFIAASVNHKELLSENNIRYFFDLIDKNSDEQMQFEEFKKALPKNY